MKKTIPTTLSNTLFYIEEDAYQRLNEYLAGIRLYFASYPQGAEIVADIENRIAEQFLESQDPTGHKAQNKNLNKENIVTLENVETLIHSMGNVEDFAEEAEGQDPASPQTPRPKVAKKLFRNEDDAMLAGVASGLAAYFGIDTSIMRLIFVLTIFFGGTGILVYIVLWLVVPPAKTSIEKLQMRGEPVTLESVNELLKKKISEVKKEAAQGMTELTDKKPPLQNFLTGAFASLGRLLKSLFKSLGPILQKTIGTILVAVFSVGTFALLLLFAIVTFNINIGALFINLPVITGASNQSLVFAGLASAFFALFLPCLFFLFLGIRILRKERVFRQPVVFSLVALWLVSLIALGVITSFIFPFAPPQPVIIQTNQTSPYQNGQVIIHWQNPGVGTSN